MHMLNTCIWTLQGCLMNITRLSHEHHKTVTWPSHEKNRNIMLQGRFLNVPHHQQREIWQGKGGRELPQPLVSGQGPVAVAASADQWLWGWPQQRKSKSLSLEMEGGIWHSYEPWERERKGAEGRREKDEGEGEREKGTWDCMNNWSYLLTL